MFDNDPLTFFHSTDTLSWGGIQFDEPQKIGKIRYIIRNDNNGIRAKEEYELLYMENNGWRSVGRKIAEKDDIISFEDVPKDALYWLKNHTRGKEERIFTCVNDSIIWW